MANTTLLDAVMTQLTVTTSLTWQDICISQLNSSESDFNWTYGLVNASGGSINSLTPKTWGITAEICSKYCGSISWSRDFNFASFSAAITNYLLPWLALTAQLPFETGDLWSNIMGFCLAVGSPAFVTYSLSITILNRYWVRKKFGGLLSKAGGVSVRQKYRDYEDRVRAAQYLLQEAQQVPLRASQAKGWLSSLIVVPGNGEWWEHLESRLKSTRRGVTASLVAQMALASVTYLFTVITSLVESLGDQTTGLQISAGSLWIWLIPVIIGWITVGTQYSHRSIDDALEAELAMRALEPPIVSPTPYLRQGQRGLTGRSGLSPQPSLVQTSLDGFDAPGVACLELPTWYGADVEGDEKRKGPIYNYARLFTWWQLASTLDHAFWNTLQNISHGNVCGSTPGPNAQPWDHQDPPANLEGDIGDSARYCGLGAARIYAYPSWSDMPSDVYRRIFAASCWGLFLQWGTTGASIFIAYLTPTVGLGCNSGGYLLYGILGTLVWACLLTSSLLSHEIMLRYQEVHITNPSMDFRARYDPQVPNPNQYTRTKSHNALCAVAVILRYFGKAVAIGNTAWLIVSSLLNFTGAYNSCWCQSNALKFGKNGWVVLFKDAHDLQAAASPSWGGGLFMTLFVCAVAIAFFVSGSKEDKD
ncbi:hypothetical protein LTR08_007214 [Meristemomyces frigidus]|nr:hypothetical protein LTR08_007214 [Meristemomyces frigidus]